MARPELCNSSPPSHRWRCFLCSIGADKRSLRPGFLALRCMEVIMLLHNIRKKFFLILLERLLTFVTARSQALRLYNRRYQHAQNAPANVN